jgi:hypothetical protein
MNRKGIALEELSPVILIIVLIGVSLAVGLMVLENMNDTLIANTQDYITNERVRDVAAIPVDFSVAGLDGVACSAITGANAYPGGPAIASKYYTQVDCSMYAPASTQELIDDCWQQMTNQTTLGDDSCSQVYTGVYDCDPPAADMCGNQDEPNAYDANFSTAFNMTSAIVRTYIGTSWIFPNLANQSTDLHGAEIRFKFSNDTNAAVTNDYTVPQDCIDNYIGTTGFTAIIQADNDSTWNIQCNNASGGWIIIDSGAYDDFEFYESQIYWNVTDAVANPYYDTDFEIDYGYTYSGTGSVGIEGTIDALADIPSWLSIIVIVIAATIILGLVTVAFSGRRE